jgi:serine/threonine protein kinase
MLKRLTLFAANVIEKPFLQNEVAADRYKVIEHLGVGSYGNSYLVVDLLSQQRKVLKALRIHKRMTKSGKKGFELEKELLKSLKHPGFPKYFEDGIYKNIPFFTMEHIQGKNFEQLIFQDEKRYSEVEVFIIAKDLLELIEYLHSNEIIHRDIRIPNVIANGPEIQLIDLGLARKIDNRTFKQKKLKGNLRNEVNVQADFYGLGHLLLFLLYSNFSFPMDKKEKSWEEELDISYEAKQIIKRLLQLGPPYENCSQIKTDIQKIIS